MINTFLELDQKNLRNNIKCIFKIIENLNKRIQSINKKKEQTVLKQYQIQHLDIGNVITGKLVNRTVID
jgi:isochorismate synthase EntC